MTGGHESEDGSPEVLVVDDEVGVADLYATWLDDEYTVRTAYDPGAALEAVSQTTDVVFLDRRMPGRSGDEVLEALREREVGCRVVMVTAVDPDFDIVDMPFDDYLTKPVERADLQRAVEEMLARDTYDRQLQEYFALASKKATLETQKDSLALRESERYSRLESEVRTVAAETDSLAASMDHQGLTSLFVEFSSD